MTQNTTHITGTATVSSAVYTQRANKWGTSTEYSGTTGGWSVIITEGPGVGALRWGGEEREKWRNQESG